MRLKITLDTIEEFNEVRSLLDKASVASYPAYSMDEKSLQWHKPTLVAVGTPNAISHVEHYVLKGKILGKAEWHVSSTVTASITHWMYIELPKL